MTATLNKKRARLPLCGLLATTALMSPAFAQVPPTEAPAAAQAAAPVEMATIGRIAVSGNQRIEPVTIASYLTVHVGSPFDPERLDESLKSLYATGLFADVKLERKDATLLITVVENPIINRIIFEGNKKVKEEDLTKETQLKPRIIYTRAKVRSDIERMLEVYRRKGRFGVQIEPKIVELDQNRVDLIYEIGEGPKSKIGRINVIGNHVFSDGDVKDAMVTTETKWWKFLSSNNTYDPDRLAYDREQVRQYYLQRGYADFRVTSAIAELVPQTDRFTVTYTVEEGEEYDFGNISVESQVKDLDSKLFERLVLMKKGDLYNAKKIEDTVEKLTNTAGLFGYAFIDIRPKVTKNKDNRTVDIVFRIDPAPRTYIERIDIHGNVRSLDKVIRREFRLVEGDAFNSALVKRSEDRINALGFFKEAKVEQVKGSDKDKVILDVSVQEQPTGELNLGGGYSSYDKFMLNFGIGERNLLGKGQSLNLNFTLSKRRKTVQLSFNEPYFLDHNISLGAQTFVQEIDNSDYTGYKQQTIGAGFQLGFSLSEYWGFGTRYSIRRDKIDFRRDLFGDEIFKGVSLEEGTDITSSVGYSLVYDSLDNRLHPTRGGRIIFSQDFAGLGGDIRFLRTSLESNYFRPLWKGFVGSLRFEGGYVKGLGQDIKISNRFFLGGPQLRGFQIAGVGPRNLTPIYSYQTETVNGGTQYVRDPATGERIPLDVDGNACPSPYDCELQTTKTDSKYHASLGGNTYYVASAEVKIPLGAGAKEMGIETSVFADIGSLWDIDVRSSDYRDVPSGISRLTRSGWKPRASVGIGFSWQSPFGPFRIDLAKALMKRKYDQTEILQFNVGTQF